MLLFQLKSKNGTFLPRPTAEQMVRRLEEKPNDWPKYTRENIMAAIMVPENHQLHGRVKNSCIANFYKWFKRNDIIEPDK